MCAATDAAPAFQWRGGQASHGPAYWSDGGACSAACALAHVQAHESRGEGPQTPAAAPFEER
ncbi:MAG TPA: hypothetical protein VL460_01200 [Caulobacteraceae bacterium]|nr:hypothetical protein [Caulobacteraceae bacterium]